MMQDRYGVEVPKTYKMSDKMESTLDTIEDIIQEGNKVIIFSKFKTSACLIAQYAYDKFKIPILMYTGGETQEVRDNNVSLFKQSLSHNVLVGTDAMAEGLNLQIAKYVINLDQPDTYAIKTQRIGRVRRTGSSFDNVVVYDMITNNGPVKSKDEERLENIERTKDASDALINIDEAQRQALLNAMKGA
jgi:superfamily II DNA/RNA helicase